MSNPTDAPPVSREPSLAERFFAAASPAPEPDSAASAPEETPPEPATSPDPVAEVPAGPPRDDRGRFASASSSPEAEPGDTATPAQDGQSAAATSDDGPTTIDALAAEYGVDQDTFLSAVHIKRGDELVPIAEAIQSAPLPDGIDPESFKAEQAQWETERAQAQQLLMARAAEFNSHLEEVAKATVSLQAMLKSGPNESELARLKAEDPERYADAIAQRTQLQEAIREAREQVERGYALQQENQSAQHAAFLQQENDALLRKMPALRDTGVRQKTMTDMANYLAAQGFTQPEISSIADHRLIVLAQKAMEYEKLQKAAPKKREEVARLPKLTKPAARQAPAEPGRQRLDAAWNALKESGGHNKAAAAALFTNLVEKEG